MSPLLLLTTMVKGPTEARSISLSKVISRVPVGLNSPLPSTGMSTPVTSRYLSFAFITSTWTSSSILTGLSQVDDRMAVARASDMNMRYL